MALIDEAETLNRHAANSLLKVLEEPTPQTVIILIASDLSRLPKTIMSRSLVLNFLPVVRSDIKNFLLSRELSEDKADKISRLALGRPGIAVNLAEDDNELSVSQNNIEAYFSLWQNNLIARLKQENPSVP